MRTAATLPERIGAGCSFHGGGLTTSNADSPHLLIPKMKASMLIAIADNDDQKDLTSKDILRKAFDDASDSGSRVICAATASASNSRSRVKPAWVERVRSAPRRQTGVTRWNTRIRMQTNVAIADH